MKSFNLDTRGSKAFKSTNFIKIILGFVYSGSIDERVNSKVSLNYLLMLIKLNLVMFF